jgi:hypothetical protein
MIRPPKVGPIIVAACQEMMFRLSADDRCSRGTRLGTIACRAGIPSVPAADESAVMI